MLSNSVDFEVTSLTITNVLREGIELKPTVYRNIVIADRVVELYAPFADMWEFERHTTHGNRICILDKRYITMYVWTELLRFRAANYDPAIWKAWDIPMHLAIFRAINILSMREAFDRVSLMIPMNKDEICDYKITSEELRQLHHLKWLVPHSYTTINERCTDAATWARGLIYNSRRVFQLIRAFLPSAVYDPKNPVKTMQRYLAQLKLNRVWIFYWVITVNPTLARYYHIPTEIPKERKVRKAPVDRKVAKTAKVRKDLIARIMSKK